MRWEELQDTTIVAAIVGATVAAIFGVISQSIAGYLRWNEARKAEIRAQILKLVELSNQVSREILCSPTDPRDALRGFDDILVVLASLELLTQDHELDVRFRDAMKRVRETTAAILRAFANSTTPPESNQQLTDQGEILRAAHQDIIVYGRKLFGPGMWWFRVRE